MKTKEEIRRAVWRLLRDRKAARFPGAEGRIPNFVGAEACAKFLSALSVWNKAKVVKINPDSPQRAVRQRALEEGKILYMPAPRLAEAKPFIELDPKRLKVSPYAASSIKGAFQHGRPVALEEMKKIDLIVCGSVAVDLEGRRVGKGGGYSDLEYALLREAKKVGARTPIITTVHPLQIVSDEIPMTEHDIPLDAVVTPETALTLKRKHDKPRGIYWDLLPSDKIDAIPVLRNHAR
ncbi:MAG TPA: 5-formyltetrahydrofolate cyclo-ligase [Verrucomicrobiae bacterium]|jgi:5-formyltetrahydrofolate cyclo-ligase|nr:5-formyltetrahydrofolate cyclo-ligase [Verrucomicrobiae bacterium]